MPNLGLQIGLQACPASPTSARPPGTAPPSTAWPMSTEPGTSELQDMIASVQNGILSEHQPPWSIDDYRNKFQFGCEYARLIHNGQLGAVVRNPNYRGITVDF